MSDSKPPNDGTLLFGGIVFLFMLFVNSYLWVQFYYHHSFDGPVAQLELEEEEEPNSLGGFLHPDGTIFTRQRVNGRWFLVHRQLPRTEGEENLEETSSQGAPTETFPLRIIELPPFEITDGVPIELNTQDLKNELLPATDRYGRSRYIPREDEMVYSCKGSLRRYEELV